MKKVVCGALLTFCLILILAPTVARATDIPEIMSYTREEGEASLLATNGILGVNNNLRWSLTGGTLIISGTGAMGSFLNGTTISTPWPYLQVQTVTIQYGVTSIGECAFYGCTNLKNITISTTVTHINNYAFTNCTSLRTISMPFNLQSIGKGAFSDCAALSSVTILNGVKNIDEFAFSGCSSLQTITIPSSVNDIGQFAFSQCVNLYRLSIAEGVKNIGKAAFWECSSLLSVVIPASVCTIGEGAFFACTQLSNIYYHGTRIQWAIIMESDEDILYPAGYPTFTIVHYMMEPLIIQAAFTEFNNTGVLVTAYTDNQSGGKLTGVVIFAAYENGQFLGCYFNERSTIEQEIDSFSGTINCPITYNPDNVTVKVFVLNVNTFSPLTDAYVL